MCDDKLNRGIGLEHGAAHSDDHDNWSRRGFLKALGLVGGGSMAMGGYSLSAMSSHALMPLIAGGNSDRILVLIRLKGGNDGLNTIVPVYDYGTYQSARPRIAVPQSQILDLNGAFGMPNTMQSLMPLWNEGAMKVINSVGYDDHNLSHFTSSDIWNSAYQDIESRQDQSGWLGRYILNQDPDYLQDLPSIPGAIKVSSGSAISYNSPERIDLAVNFNTPERLIQIAESGLVYDTSNPPDDCYYGEQVTFLRSIINVTYNYAPQISEAYQKAVNNVSYSSNELSRQLAIVARLIKGGLGTRLYMVTLDGFDTHEGQNNRHPQLMQALSSAVGEFYSDLSSSGFENDVLSMTFSEFGRRIRENDGGTDHGTAAPVMMFGPALNGNGVLGDDPDLNDVDMNGNLKHTVDFRSIYATILESWLCLDPVGVDEVLGDDYERLPDLGINCENVSTQDIALVQAIRHKAIPDGMGGVWIQYELDRPGNLELSVYTFMGQKISTLASRYHRAGEHKVKFENRQFGLSAAPLIYRIVVNGQQYTGKFIIGS